MITRRIVLAGAAALALTASASAQDWKAKYPELTFAVVPAENASGVTERWTPFVNYLSKELGVKVTLRIANDYAAVIEGQRSGNIQIASYGSASFARARLTGVKTDAFANDINADGSTGYYSMFFVKASSPYKTIEDVKGKNLGLVDPNSTSGNNVPRFELNKKGIPDAEAYFSKVVFTGSHENAMLALSQGTVDVAANQWTSDDDSTLAQMLHKGMLKNADGSPMKKEDFRIINKSAEIINGPYAYNSDLPDDLKAAIAKAFFDVPTKDKATFDKLSDGQKKGFHPATTKDWDGTIELIKFVELLAQEEGVLIGDTNYAGRVDCDPACFPLRASRSDDHRRIHPSRPAARGAERGLSQGGRAQAVEDGHGGGGVCRGARRRWHRRRSEPEHALRLFRQLRLLFRPHPHAR